MIHIRLGTFYNGDCDGATDATDILKFNAHLPTMLLLLQGLSICLFSKIRPGQTPQSQQLNPTVQYRVANSLDSTAQFYMGGAGQEYFEVHNSPV